MFELALKLETRMSPGFTVPPVGNHSGTNATPYGFTSPLAGTVETSSVGFVGSSFKIELPALDIAAPHTSERMTNRFSCVLGIVSHLIQSRTVRKRLGLSPESMIELENKRKTIKTDVGPS